MLIECSFKSGILKLKIHMTNLALPERSNLRKCQQRKKLISGVIASLDTIVKNCYSFLLCLNLKLKEAVLGYDNFNPRTSSFIAW